MKKRDEIKELRSLGTADLEKRLDAGQEELMKLKFKHASGQLPQAAALRSLRRSVARAQTARRELKA
jgi:ribosomal protein L29